MLEVKFFMQVLEPTIAVANQRSPLRRLFMSIADPQAQEGVAGHFDIDVSKSNPDAFINAMREALSVFERQLLLQREEKKLAALASGAIDGD